MIKLKTFFIFSILFTILNTYSFSELFFNGLAGGRTSFNSDKEEEEFDPQMEVQAFFAGQFNISEDIILHGEFSIKTEDLIENSIFNETDASFQIDELSFVMRKLLVGTTNYFSAFIGTYEPIGSDLFLRRHFGIQPISSILTESWLGIAGSVIYPLFGAGVADVIHFEASPTAIGFYTYVNHELDDSFVLNLDARFACIFRYFTLDFATGIGSPLKTNSYEDAFLVIDKLYWRAGMNMLIGNAYTTSLFIQAGASEIPFTKNNQSFSVSDINTYILFEPRFNLPKCRIDLTFFSLPAENTKEFIFIEDTLGLNFNVHSDDFYIKNQNFTFGIMTALSFPEKYFMDLKDFSTLFEDYTITLTPYLNTKLFNGELHTMFKCKITDFINDKWYKGLILSIGYKAHF